LKKIEIKLCPKEAQTCALQFFCDRDLDINFMTTKLDILKIYLHTENEFANFKPENSKHSTLSALSEYTHLADVGL